MKAEEFNKLLIEIGTEKLVPLGFKRKGHYFYLQQGGNLMVLYKKTFLGLFEGMFLALTHDFFDSCKDPKGKLKIPAYLEAYPVSISLEVLRHQYTRVSVFSIENKLQASIIT